jgi:formylglycine-generating enzyme
VSGNRFTVLMAALVLAVTARAARADVFNMGSGLTSLEFVTVGNPGNAGELNRSADAEDNYYGAVDYVYAIGKYEVTTAQYRTFLNAVAATDTYGLYNTDMWSQEWGCKIERTGSAGSYEYSVAADRANRPVNYVSWGDAARFMNWLHNDQPIGAQGARTTERGAYTLDGATTRDELMAVTRNADARYWIPTENEWYKAAYHKNDGVTGNYWDYPTRSDSTPSNQLLDPDPGNNANFMVRDGDREYSIGDPYWMTEVGAFENSESPYGTFDQGGNVQEWHEAVLDSTGGSRGQRGGNFSDDYGLLLSRYPQMGHPTNHAPFLGFRVASVPEPGSITLMSCGALAGLYFWRRRRRT